MLDYEKEARAKRERNLKTAILQVEREGSKDQVDVLLEGVSAVE